MAHVRYNLSDRYQVRLMITGLGMSGPFITPFQTVSGALDSKWTMTTSGNPAICTVFPSDLPQGIVLKSTPVPSPESAS
jgi:hypothetical protein